MYVFFGFQPMEWSKSVMFKHAVFSPFHRLKPKENEDFKKHYFGISCVKSFEEMNIF